MICLWKLMQNKTIVIQTISKVIFHSIIKFPSFWRVCNQLKSLPDKRNWIPHLNHSGYVSYNSDRSDKNRL